MRDREIPGAAGGGQCAFYSFGGRVVNK